jgi:predicted nucleic acid-binding protein
MASDATPYLIDANVYLGLANSHDSLHVQAQEAISHLEKHGCSYILLDHVIQEILTVLLYSSHGELIEAFLERAFGSANIFPVDTPIEWLQAAAAMARENQYKPKMSLIDWLLLYRSKTTGAPILTFDKQLLAASKKLC